MAPETPKRSRALSPAEGSPTPGGRAPAPLALDGEFAELVELERLGVAEGYKANMARRAFVARAHDPTQAALIIARIGLDFGDVPDSIDASKAKTKSARAALDKAHSALVVARFQRQETFGALHSIAARDLAFQAAAFAKLDELAALPGGAHLRAVVQHALMTSGALAPPLLEAAKAWLRASEPSAQRSTAIVALLKQSDAVAFATVGALLANLDRTDENAVMRAKDIVEAGASIGFWTHASEEWRALLMSFAALANNALDVSKPDGGRALWQLANQAKAALQPRPVAPPPAVARRAAPAAAASSMNKPPLDKKKLRSAKGREALLDELGLWIVDTLAALPVGTANDDDAARAVLRGAIAAFYDVRQAADQPRGEFAGAFFQVDAVGLGASSRPVPWVALRARIGDERVKKLDVLLDEVEATVE